MRRLSPRGGLNYLSFDIMAICPAMLRSSYEFLDFVVGVVYQNLDNENGGLADLRGFAEPLDPWRDPKTETQRNFMNFYCFDYHRYWKKEKLFYPVN
jgi:hypothetical protein